MGARNNERNKDRMKHKKEKTDREKTERERENVRQNDGMTSLKKGRKK